MICGRASTVSCALRRLEAPPAPAAGGRGERAASRCRRFSRSENGGPPSSTSSALRPDLRQPPQAFGDRLDLLQLRVPVEERHHPVVVVPPEPQAALRRRASRRVRRPRERRPRPVPNARPASLSGCRTSSKRRPTSRPAGPASEGTSRAPSTSSEKILSRTFGGAVTSASVSSGACSVTTGEAGQRRFVVGVVLQPEARQVRARRVRADGTCRRRLALSRGDQSLSAMAAVRGQRRESIVVGSDELAPEARLARRARVPALPRRAGRPAARARSGRPRSACSRGSSPSETTDREAPGSTSGSQTWMTVSPRTSPRAISSQPTAFFP